MKDGLNEPGDLFSKPPKASSVRTRVVQEVGKFAKDHGQSPPGPVSPRARKLLEKAEQAILTQQQREIVASDGFVGLFKGLIGVLIETKAGAPFRQEYRRKMAAIVLGEPYGDTGIIIDAIEALTKLAVCSIKEDKYGQAQRDVKLIIRTFTNTVTKLEGFKKSVGIHWTDIERKSESPETETILTALRDGLTELIRAFGDYSEDLRLSQSEMRMAREAATSTPTPGSVVPEMAQKK